VGGDAVDPGTLNPIAGQLFDEITGSRPVNVRIGLRDGTQSVQIGRPMRAAFILLMLFCWQIRGEEEVKQEKPPDWVEKFFAFKIPKIACEDTNLNDLVLFLSTQIRMNDPREKPGVSLLLKDLDAERVFDKKADYIVENVSVNQVFTDLAGIYRVEFHFTSAGVIITPVGGKPFPNAKMQEGTLFYTYRARKTETEEPKQP
jgi:hypothetical protein